jgi:hypothetical protein
LEADLEATSVTDEGTTFTFELEATRPFIYFKACWKVGDETRWAVGSNALVLMTAHGTRDMYPYFSGSENGSFSPLIEIDSPVLGRTHVLRAYLPAGYNENTLKKYPVFFMQDARTCSSRKRPSSGATGRSAARSICSTA